MSTNNIENSTLYIFKDNKWYRTNRVGSSAATDTEVSWNDLTNKPFYEEVVEISETIQWDGQPTYENGQPRPSVNLGDLGIFYLIDISTPTIEEFVGAHVEDNDQLTLTLTEDNCQQLTEDLLGVVVDSLVVVIVVYKDNLLLEGLQFPQKGVYASFQEAIHYPLICTKAEGKFSTHNIQKLDNKFIQQQIVPISMSTAQYVDLGNYPVGTLFALYNPEAVLGE